MTGKKGQWVQVHSIVLEPEKRSDALPEDTKKVPLEMWVKGYLTADAEAGADCRVETVTGRLVCGRLVEVEPSYSHDFGKYVPELDAVRKQVRSMLGGDGL